MKVVCVDNNESFGVCLTLGKTYEVIRESEDGDVFYLKDDYESGEETIGWAKHRFITLDELRDNKLNSIL